MHSDVLKSSNLGQYSVEHRYSQSCHTLDDPSMPWSQATLGAFLLNQVQALKELEMFKSHKHLC